MILETVRQAQERTGQPETDILASLGLPPATYYRWQVRAVEGRLADEVIVPRRRAILPTPEEVATVRGFALAHPQTGYKRLTWQMVLEDVAYLRPYQASARAQPSGLSRSGRARFTVPTEKPSSGSVEATCRAGSS